MVTLSKAPLIEIIFELHWEYTNSKKQQKIIEEERSFFAGQFKSVAKAEGFGYIEPLSIPVPIPHVVTHRFREAENTWPCYQIGNGIFAVNITNEFYNSWSEFKNVILKGLELLDDGHPLGLADLPISGTELRYIDGLTFSEGEESIDFINEKLQIAINIPDNLSNHPCIDSDNINTQIIFAFDCNEPNGKLIFQLEQGTINGRNGLLATTVVRSIKEHSPANSKEAIDSWLENAHKVQKHFFENIIEPKYMETLK